MYSNSGLCQKLTNLHFLFTYLSHYDSSLSRFQQSTWLLYNWWQPDDKWRFPSLSWESTSPATPFVACASTPSSSSALRRHWGRGGGSAIARCGSGRCEALSGFLSSSLLSASSSPPPSGSSGKPRQCEAPGADEKGRERPIFIKVIGDVFPKAVGQSEDLCVTIVTGCRDERPSVDQHVCVLLTSSRSVRYGFVKSGAFSVIPSSCDIWETSGIDGREEKKGTHYHFKRDKERKLDILSF